MNIHDIINLAFYIYVGYKLNIIEKNIGSNGVDIDILKKMRNFDRENNAKRFVKLHEIAGIKFEPITDKFSEDE